MRVTDRRVQGEGVRRPQQSIAAANSSLRIHCIREAHARRKVSQPSADETPVHTLVAIEDKAGRSIGVDARYSVAAKVCRAEFTADVVLLVFGEPWLPTKTSVDSGSVGGVPGILSIIAEVVVAEMALSTRAETLVEGVRCTEKKIGQPGTCA